jgi:hypothetical protein
MKLNAPWIKLLPSH